MTRPYMNFLFKDLEQVFEKSKNNKKVLQDICDELNYRHKNPKIPGLRRKLEAFLGGQDKTAQTEGSVSQNNDPKAIVGGLILGVAEAQTSGFISIAFKNTLAFVVIIVVLLLRPEGLLGVEFKERV